MEEAFFGTRLAMTPQFYSSLKHLDTSTLRHCFLYTQTLLFQRHYGEKSQAIKDNFMPADNMCG